MTRNANVAGFLLGGKDPGRIALRPLHGQHTYGEVALAAARAAHSLNRAGGTKGDRVILIGDNSLFWAGAYLGTLQAGLVSVPLPANVPVPALEDILQVTEARFAFVQSGYIPKHAAHLKGVQLLAESDALPGAVRDERPVPLERDDLAALMFTSGSTGKPRGVMVSHGNIIANTQSIIEYLGLTENDRIMALLPFHYCFGTSLLHTHLKVGGSLVVGSRFLYPEAVLQRMAQTECTGFAGVPSHFQILLRKTSLRKWTFPSLRYVQQAGGSLATPFLRELRAALPGAQVFVMYGQTEATARLSYLPPELLDTKAGSIGKGIPGVTLRVLSESGNEVAPGEVGEIVAEGENVTLGYWRAPDETAISYRDGRLYTGDLASVDGEGFIYVAGRTRDFLKCGGQRVGCRQLEESLLECENLLEAAVTGMPDEVLGEAVRAFVVGQQQHCGESCEWRDCRKFKERLNLHCREHMPAPLVPKEVVLLPALPKNSAGKVLKQTLTAM